MFSFIGEYNCKIDTKNRFVLPSAFKKQMTNTNQGSFVIRKDLYENCLVLLPINEWVRQMEIIKSKINPYNKEHLAFQRAFHAGAEEVELDGSGRLLIPAKLLALIGVDKDVVLAGQDTRIELWAASNFNNELPSNFEEMAQKIMC